MSTATSVELVRWSIRLEMTGAVQPTTQRRSASNTQQQLSASPMSIARMLVRAAGGGVGGRITGCAPSRRSVVGGARRSASQHCAAASSSAFSAVVRPAPCIRACPVGLSSAVASRGLATSAKTSLASSSSSAKEPFGHSRQPLPILLLPEGSAAASSASTGATTAPSSSHSISLNDSASFSSRSSRSGLFELTFLGTASGRPTPVRNVTSLALRVGSPRRPRLLMFDAGDGTQSRLLQARHLSLAQLSLIFVTHMHGDHVFGLANLIAASCNRPTTEPLHIFGPMGIAQYLKQTLSATHTWLDRPLIFHELLKNNVAARTLSPQPDVLYHQNSDYSQLNMQIYEDDEIVVHAGSLKHRDLSCWGYVVSEKASLAGPLHHPRKVAILGDTCDSSGLQSVAQGADAMVHEATFLETEISRVYSTGHSTAGMAGAFARQCDVRHLILTHFSHRYIGAELETGVVDVEATREHVAQARLKTEHDRVHAAQDLQVFHIAPTPLTVSRAIVPQPHSSTTSSLVSPSALRATTSTPPKAPKAKTTPPPSPPATKSTTLPGQRPTLHIAMPKPRPPPMAPVAATSTQPKRRLSTIATAR